MLPVSVKSEVTFTPAHYAADNVEAPVYRVGVPSEDGKVDLERAVRASGARPVTREDLYALLRQAVTELLEADDQAAALLAIEQHAQLDELPEAARRDVQRAVAALEDVAMRWPPYAAAVADQEYWWKKFQLEAARRFLRGWSNVKHPFAAKHGRVTDEAFNALPSRDVYAIGAKVVDLTYLTEADRKNS